MPAETLPGMAPRQRLHHRVGELVARAEAGDGRRREGRVGQAALGRHDGDRPDQAGIDRDVAVDLGVEQHRADGEPDRDVGGAFERHVDRPVGHLRRRAGEVDDQAVVLLGDGDDDRQLLLGRIVAVEIAVDRRLGAIDAVRQPGDRLAHQPLGMIHQRGRRPGRRSPARSARPARPCARRRCARPRPGRPCRRPRGRRRGCCRARSARPCRSSRRGRRP